MQNREEAVKWFRASASQDYAHAQFVLGYCYNSDGRGVRKNLTTSFEWFRKAADQGHHRGMFSLGRCYELGRGTRSNLASAREWHQRSSSGGYDESTRAPNKGLLTPSDPTVVFSSKRIIWGTLENAL